MTRYLTLADENQFQFTCPIFNVNTKMRLCMQLRELFWMGKKPDVRRGCQACMASSKCPAAAIVSKISHMQGKAPDEYGALTPVDGRLRRDILERVHRPIVMEKTLNDFQVPDAERALIAGASERIGKMIGAAPLPSNDDAPTYREQPAKSAPKRRAPANNNNAIAQAAATGDLAAAVNQ